MSFFDLLFQMLCWFILIGTPFWPIILHLASCLHAIIYACLSIKYNRTLARRFADTSVFVA